jgi:hypothetical protein
MKNTLLKVMGIVMTLAILAGLLMASVPVSAAAMAWSANAVPAVATATAPNILTASTTANRLLALAPNGTTVLVYDNGTMYKSVNSGVAFASTTTTTYAPPAGLTKIEFASDSLGVVATDGVAVYYSADGGSTFANSGCPLTTINSIDVAPGPVIMAGGTTTYAVFSTGGLFSGGWQVRPTTAAPPILFPLAGSVIGVAFSPNYATDNLIVLITNDGTNTYARYQWAARGIGEQYADKIVAAGAATSAQIAFPSDFSVFTNANFVVGLDNGLYRMAIGAYTGAVPAVASGVKLSGQAVSSLSFMGTWAAGTAYFTSGATVNRLSAVSTAAMATVELAVASAGVYGANAYVAASSAAVYALSSGAGGAFYMSANGAASFVATQLIQVTTPVFAQIAIVDAKTMFIVMTDTGVSSIFKTVDGAAWQRIQYGGLYNAIYPSPAFATDNTLYITSSSSTTYKSIDGGMSLIPFVAAGAVTAMAVVDANTYYYIAGGSIYKSGSYTALSTTGYYSLEYISATLMYAGGNNGNVYQSVDGATFAAVKTTAPFTAGNVVVAANAAGALYVGDASANGGVKYFSAVAAAWVAYGTTTALPAAVISDLALAADGTLYAAVIGQNVYRNADGKNWQSTAWTGTVDANSRLTFVAGNLYVTGPAGIANFTETLSAAPVITSPAAGALVDSNSIVLTWNAVAGATGYAYSITDSFGGLIITNAATTLTTVYVLPATAGIRNGVQYNLTVQTTAPFYSKVSAPVSFTTKLTNAGANLTAVGGLAPAAGSSMTTTSPTFNWAAVANATSYDIKISSKADFSDTIDSMTGLTSTVYTTNVKLTPGVYYWEIRAANATTKSDWVQSTFTVVAPAPTTTAAPPITVTGAAPNVTVNVPTQPAQVQPTVIVNVPTSTPNTQTPAWAWIVIAIGAVLVIAVIVLIVRTRKV